jgi:hypothetical protein
LFSLNHKKVKYSRKDNNIDFKKLRQYVFVQKSQSLYLMDDFLLLESTTSDSIDTGNTFLNQ